MRKNNVLHVRISADAKNNLKRKAGVLGCSVSELIERFANSYLDVLQIFKKDIGLYITRSDVK